MFACFSKHKANNKNTTLPLVVADGILLSLVEELSFAIQLLEVEDVVDDTPVVTD